MDDVFFAAELGADVPEVDLHGMSQHVANDVLESAIGNAFMNNETIIRIIHGHGNGVLREMVQKKLEVHPNVRSHKTGSGVSYAEIEPR